MAMTVRHDLVAPEIVFTRHALKRIRQRTNLRPYTAREEIKEALGRGLERDGRNAFRATSECGTRSWILAMTGGKWHVLTVLC